MIGTTVAEESGAVSITTSSKLMEVKEITEALGYLTLVRTNTYKRAVAVSDLICTLRNIQLERKHLPRFGVHHFGQVPPDLGIHSKI